MASGLFYGFPGHVLLVCLCVEAAVGGGCLSPVRVTPGALSEGAAPLQEKAAGWG